MQTRPHAIPLHTRNLAAVSYIPLMGFIVLYGHRHEPFIGFHAWQGTLLSLYIAASYFVPTLGSYIALLFSVIAVNGFIHAAKGENYSVPILGGFLSWILYMESPRHTQHLKEIRRHRANIHYLLTL